jgi:predicted ribosome quality control (RQC) complex YloA/Tae2 family protein
MDWMEIGRLIEMEKAHRNPVAEIIKLPLKLYENTATLLLGEVEEGEEDFEGDETDSDAIDSDGDTVPNELKVGEGVDKRLSVDIDLGLSPWANARQYYDQKRNAAVKEQKTLQSSSKALKSTEKKITADLKKGLKQEKQVLRPVRAPLWFEKFYFFISSDGYLVLGYFVSLLRDWISLTIYTVVGI